MDQHLETMNQEIQEGKAQLFDVREQHEWDVGHLKTASLVPLSDLNGGHSPEGKDPNVKTYLHCRSGKRVLTAKPLLEAMGYVNVIPLNEGFDYLAKQGFEAEG